MYNIAVLAGDGIGPEVMDASMLVLDAVQKKFSLTFKFTEANIGGVAIDRDGKALPEKTLDVCRAAEGSPSAGKLPA